MREVFQITMPTPDDTDSHPRLMIYRHGLHCGEIYEVLLPTGWEVCRFESKWEITGWQTWYIVQHPDICPVGLFVREVEVEDDE